jgi:hypothetical protein
LKLITSSMLLPSDLFDSDIFLRINSFGIIMNASATLSPPQPSKAEGQNLQKQKCGGCPTRPCPAAAGAELDSCRGPSRQPRRNAGRTGRRDASRISDGHNGKGGGGGEGVVGPEGQRSPRSLSARIAANVTAAHTPPMITAPLRVRPYRRSQRARPRPSRPTRPPSRWGPRRRGPRRPRARECRTCPP